MADDAVVVGGGPGGLRAAVALAKAGRRVTLLQEGAFAGGSAHPDIPVGRGASSAPGALALGLYGEFRAVAGADRGIQIGGRTHALPIGRAELARILPPTKAPAAALAWSRTRGAIELRKIIGGGAELRTYEDWVVQRFGRPVFEALYADYCQARFGPPNEISCNVARVVHGIVSDAPLVAPAAGPALSTAGVDVRTSVVVKRIRTGQVETEDGLFTGEVFVDIAPRRVVEWLDDLATAALQNDVGFLHARTALQVLVQGPQELPFETHVLGGAPFYRVVRPGLVPGCGGLADMLCAHYALDAGDPLLSADDDDVVARTVAALAEVGIAGASPVGGRVQRIRDHHPVWSGTHLVRLRRYVLALEDLEIVPVGRAGLHAPLDLATDAAYLEAVLAEERAPLRGIVRDVVEPPVLDPADRAHLTRFVER